MKSRQFVCLPGCLATKKTLNLGVLLKKEFAPRGANSFLQELTLLRREVKIRVTELYLLKVCLLVLFNE